MTENDLNRIERQIENLQVMHKVSEVEKELEELERELHQLLPVSTAIHQGQFSVNPKQVHGQAEDLPAWCSKISTLLKSMAILLATLGGKEIDILDLVCPRHSQDDKGNAGRGQSTPAGSLANGFIGRSQSFSTREDVEEEIKQFGVSVKNLKANYEVQNQTQSAENRGNRVYRRKRSLPVVSKNCSHPETIHENEIICSATEPLQSNGSAELNLESGLPLVEEPLITASYAPPTYTSSEVMAPNNLEQFSQVLSSDPILNNGPQVRSFEVQTDVSYVQECIEMRKERIVLLFLEHWRKYAVSESYQTKYSGRKANEMNVAWEDHSQLDAQFGSELQSEDDRLLLLMKSKQVVGNLIGHWRTIISQVPTRQIRRLSRAKMIYWPEHFLPHMNGSPVDYDNLTLDLFMLGYFQLLEMNMSRNERKFRHLLCYEMFDRLGNHEWENIRQFHKEVMADIEKGRRDWLDGFEDIKVKYFGDSTEDGGVMTVSLCSVSPDVAIMPVQELPPPPSHPPPPPPPNNPADSPAHLQPSLATVPVELEFSTLTSPVVVNDCTSGKQQCKGKRSNGESLAGTVESDVKAGVGILLNAQVMSNGKTLETGHLEGPSGEALPRTNASGNVEKPQNQAETWKPEPVKDVPTSTVKTIEEPRVDKPPSKSEPNENSIKVIYELKEFSNEEIVTYINRSFAFWKEKEAELFDI